MRAGWRRLKSISGCDSMTDLEPQPVRWHDWIRGAAHRAAPLALAMALVGIVLGGLLIGYEPVGGDPDRLYRPLKSELSRSLAAGELPFWSNRFGLGVPLVAESHVAAFYPPNLLLVPRVRCLDGVSPVDVAALRGTRRHNLRATLEASSYRRGEAHSPESLSVSAGSRRSIRATSRSTA